MAEVLEYKCPCCGGAIAFDAKEQKLKCPYCDTEFEAEILAAYDEQLRGEQKDDMKWEREGDNIRLSLTLPKAMTATLVLKDGWQLENSENSAIIANGTYYLVRR